MFASRTLQFVGMHEHALTFSQCSNSTVPMWQSGDYEKGYALQTNVTIHSIARNASLCEVLDAAHELVNGVQTSNMHPHVDQLGGVIVFTVYAEHRQAALHLDYIVVTYLYADPDLMKEVTVRQFMTFHDRPPWPLPTANGKIESAVDAWMIQAKGSYWSSLRAAAQPLFHSDRRGRCSKLWSPD